MIDDTMIDDTMIDEERLRAILARLAESEPVSTSAMTRLLDALTRTETERSTPSARRRLRIGLPVNRRRRLGVAVAAAAAVVLVAGSLTAALGGGSTATGNITPSLAAHVPAPAVGFAPTLGSGDAAASATATTVVASPAATAQAGTSAAASAPSGDAASADVPLPADTTRVVKNGQIDLIVRQGRVEPVLAEISLLSAAQGGYVSSTSTSLGQGSPSGTVVVEIPEARFDVVVDQVRALGQVDELSTSGQDVTAHYVDLQAQITAAQQSEQRYLTILGQATSISDILAVQQQIDSIDTQLQQLQGEQQLLDQQTTYGSLSVSVAESSKVLVVSTPSGWSRAWHNAAHGFAGASEAIVSASGVVAFVALFLSVVVGLGWMVWRRARPRIV